MKHIATLLLAAALAAGAGFTASASTRTVTVTGTGRIAAEASSASFSAYVETTADTQQEAAAENARRTRALREALLATGARMDQLTTENYTVNPIYVYDQKKGTSTLRGYRAVNQMNVRVPYLSLTGFLIDAAAENGADRVDSLQFQTADGAPYRLKAYAAAADDARRQAQALADTLGLTLGPALTVCETGYTPPVMRREMVFLAKAANAGSAVTPVEAGAQTVTAQLNITYALL